MSLSFIVLFLIVSKQVRQKLTEMAAVFSIGKPDGFNVYFGSDLAVTDILICHCDRERVLS